MISLDTGLWRGQGAGFSPLSLSPLAWWDWSDTSQLYTDSGLTTLVSADGDPIGGIKDKSGSNYHLVQTDGTKKGLYKINIQNRKSVGRTNGVNDFWKVASSTALFKCLHYGGATVFFAGKLGTTNSANAAYPILGNNNASPSAIGCSLYYDGRSVTSAVSRAGSVITSGSVEVVNNTSWADNAMPSNTPLVCTYKMDPQNATVGNRMYVYKGSGAAQSGNTFTGTASSGSSSLDLGIGVFNGNTPSSFFAPNDFYELLIYPTLLSDANRSAVTSYLMSKWGVT